MSDANDVSDHRPLIFIEIVATVCVGFLLVIVAIGGPLMTIQMSHVFEDFGVELPVISVYWVQYPFLPSLLSIPSAALLIISATAVPSAGTRWCCRLAALLLLLLVIGATALALWMPMVKIHHALS